MGNRFCKYCNRDLPIGEFKTYSFKQNGKKYTYPYMYCKICMPKYYKKRWNINKRNSTYQQRKKRNPNIVTDSAKRQIKYLKIDEVSDKYITTLLRNSGYRNFDSEIISKKKEIIKAFRLIKQIKTKINETSK